MPARLLERSGARIQASPRRMPTHRFWFLAFLKKFGRGIEKGPQPRTRGRVSEVESDEIMLGTGTREIHILRHARRALEILSMA